MTVRDLEADASASIGSEESADWFGSDTRIASDSNQVRAEYVDSKGRPLSWADSVRKFRSKHGPEHRFGKRWASGLWGKWLDRDRKLVSRTETTLMLSLTASPWLSDSHILPPANHLESLLKGLRIVCDELSDSIGASHRIGWGLGTQRTGYAHAHVGIYCFDHVDPIVAEPVLDEFTRTVPMADPSEHGAGAITARHGADMLAERTATDDRAPATSLGAYLADNVPGSGSTPEAGMGVENELGAGDAHRVQLATVLDATETEAYRRPAL